MRTDLFDHVTLSPSERKLRFTKFPGPRTRRIRNLDGIEFRRLPRMMTKHEAARWLRGQREYALAGWREAIERCLKSERKHAASPPRNANPLLPEEIDATSGLLPEGAMRRVFVNAYERSAQARAQCLDFYGTACTVCGLDFGVAYGEEAAGYIHVHHLTPLASIKSSYEVDPLHDLVPVCPNCHAVIHLGGAVRDVETVRRMLERQAEEDEDPSGAAG